MNILSDYKQIESEVQSRILKSPMYYDAVNHPDEKFLKTIYPGDVLQNMPDWIKHQLASEESKRACERYTEAIMRDASLLDQFMKDYDISQRAIDACQTEEGHQPFASGHLSHCCLNISGSMDIVKKCILKKPFYGMMIESFGDSSKAPLDSITSKLSYESEKRRLEKKLAKQKQRGQ